MDLDALKEAGEALTAAGIESADEFEKALVTRVKGLGLKVNNLDIQYDKGVATVMGMAPDQTTKEKVLVAVANVKGVIKVKDSVVVGLSAAEQAATRKAAAERAAAKEAEAKAAADKAAEKARKEALARFQLEQKRAAIKRELATRFKKAEEAAAATYTVKSGDSLRKIAKKHYGDESKWKAIFEANQPMIKKADLIYPGQILRIPKL